MPKPRKTLVSLDATRITTASHDAFTGKSQEHRRQWIQHRPLALTDIFAIDIAAYAIISNHYHLVLHINRDTAIK